MKFVLALFLFLRISQAFLVSWSSCRKTCSIIHARVDGSNDALKPFHFSSLAAPLAILGTNFLPIFPLEANALPQSAPITNAQMLLIQALPEKNPVLNDLALSLAKITTEGSGNIRSVDSKGMKGIKPWPEVMKAQRAASGLVSSRSKDLLTGVKAKDEKEAQAALTSLQKSISQLATAAENQDRPEAVKAQVDALKAIDKLGTLEVSSFPFTPTADYPKLPKLLGRAELEFTVKNKKTGKTSSMYAILDGFSSPLSAGSFLDIVNRKAFENSPIIGTDESSVTFAVSDPSKVPTDRTLPLEVLVAGDKAPTYGETLDESGRFQEKVVLPFNAYGTLALSHPPDDVNGGNGAQAFFLKADPAYTPAGLNTYDGAYSVIGYVVEGAEALDLLEQGDVIESVKILSGLNYLS